MSKEDKVALMERALDNLPERDSSSSGSLSARSTRSAGSVSVRHPLPSAGTAHAVSMSRGVSSEHVVAGAHAASRMSPDAQRIARLGSQLSVFSTVSHDQTDPKSRHRSSSSGSRSRSVERDYGGISVHRHVHKTPDARESEELLNTGNSVSSIAAWKTRGDGMNYVTSHRSHESSRPSSAPNKRGMTLPLDTEPRRDSRPNSAGSSRSLGAYSSNKHSPRCDGSDGLRNYYDIDIDVVTKAQERTNSMSPGSPRVAGLTKLNPDTFLLTPSKSDHSDLHSATPTKTGLHGSISMGDVRLANRPSEFSGASRTNICKSDDALDNSFDISGASPTPYRYTSLRQAYNQGTLMQKSGKCLSMPDVGDKTWSLTDNLYEASPRHDEYRDSSSRSHQDILSRNDGNVTTRSRHLSRFQSQDNLPSSNSNSVKHKSRHKVSTLMDTFTTPYRPKRTDSASRDKRHHVSFKNLDLNTSGSDESVKSFASTSSVNSFRQVLKAKSSESSSGGKSSKKPLKVVRSGGEASSDSEPVHRPIAMCTRTTQVPSPLPNKRK